MCSPPSWKSSEGEDVEGDYSVWSSNREDNEDSDWIPEVEGKSTLLLSFIWMSSFVLPHLSCCCCHRGGLLCFMICILLPGV
jgi:hypothetical protein